MLSSKKILSNSKYLLIKFTLSTIIGLFLTRLTLEFLGIENYGIVSVVGGVVFLLTFLNNVLISSTFRFIAYEEGRNNPKSLNNTFNQSLTIHICLGVIIIVLGEIFGNYYINNGLEISSTPRIKVSYLFRILLLSSFITISSTPFQGLLIAKEKFKVIAIAEISKLSLQLLLIYFALNQNLGDHLRTYSNIVFVSTILPPMVYFTYSIKKYSGDIKWNFNNNFYQYKDFFNYSLWILIGAFAVTCELQFSNVLLNKYFGASINAAYGLALSVNHILKTFGHNIIQASVPSITKNYGKKEISSSVQLSFDSSRYAFFMCLFVGLPLILETDFIINLWLKDVPPNTIIFIRILLISTIINSISSGIPSIIHASNNIRSFQIITSLLVLLGIPFSFILFENQFPPETLSFIFLIISLLNTIIVLFFMKIRFKMTFEVIFTNFFRYILKVVLLILPGLLIIKFFSISSSLVTLVILTIYVVLVILSFGLSSQEKNNLIKILTSKGE